MVQKQCKWPRLINLGHSAMIRLYGYLYFNSLKLNYKILNVVTFIVTVIDSFGNPFAFIPFVRHIRSSLETRLQYFIFV